MTLPELLTVTRQARIRLEARGDSLHVEAPAGTVTPELRAALVAHKPALLDVLAPIELVSLQGGLVVPRPALDLVLDLEARGVPLRTDADHQFILPDDARLTETDRAALARWRHHVAALIEYQAPVPAWVQ